MRSARLWLFLPALLPLSCGTSEKKDPVTIDASPPEETGASPMETAAPMETAPPAPSFGIAQRPANPTCRAPAEVPDMGVAGLPARLSQTGCFEAGDPTRPVAALIPYEVNAP